VDLGSLNGVSIGEYHHFFHFVRERLFKAPAGGETGEQIQKRVWDFIRQKAHEHRGKTILVVTHRLPIAIAQALMNGIGPNDFRFWDVERSPKNGEVILQHFPNWPFNSEGEVDLHRPYIDEIVLKCEKCGGEMKRVKELVDVWFDSGAMPFAQGLALQEYSMGRAGAKKIGEPVEGQFPADYICEGIDQTRGWFYTLHAVSTLLENGPAYRNVITYGHLLDKEGKKMSKSIGNVVDPWKLIDAYGIDTLRWYFYTVNAVGEPTLFNEDGVKERQRKFIMTVLNSLAFLETYWDGSLVGERTKKIALDRWIFSRLHSDISYVTEALERYDIVGAARRIELLVDDLSNWYIRSSRGRLQNPDPSVEKATAQSVLYFTLSALCRMLAPFTPFLAEMVFSRLSALDAEEHESVHLAEWPRFKKREIDQKLEDRMSSVRSLARKALAERASAGIKVRQKLARLTLNERDKKAVKGLEQFLAEEVNVSEIVYSSEIDSGLVRLDTSLTPELVREGVYRELVRGINELRKKAGLSPKDRIHLIYYVAHPDGTDDAFTDKIKELTRDVRASEVTFRKVFDKKVQHERDWKDQNWTLRAGIHTL
jgi:isoleucyl-tRNA synthetase